MESVRIEKLVHGGQGLGQLPDGRKVFVWNALPGELVKVRIIKRKKDYAEAVAEEIVEPSVERIGPHDEAYLSTSPWQIMTLAAEDKYKQEILLETLTREKVVTGKTTFVETSVQAAWKYRNKMEYSFWGDDDGLHLALFQRASHRKRIVSGSSLARPEIDEAAGKIRDILNKSQIRASQLKTVIVRCNQKGETAAALFVKDERFPKVAELEAVGRGLAVYYSNPKSPASIITRELYQFGDITLTDNILGTPISYDVNSFFQVNLPVFEAALAEIKKFTKDADPIVDFYSGVGTIGVPLGATKLVESDEHNIEMAQQNIGKNSIEIIKATAETALQHIPNKGALIVDPPRAGLHKKVVEQILETKPERIAYLSCNPATQARDLALLQTNYDIKTVTGYNFFPRTPHIESLAVMIRK